MNYCLSRSPPFLHPYKKPSPLNVCEKVHGHCQSTCILSSSLCTLYTTIKQEKAGKIERCSLRQAVRWIDRNTGMYRQTDSITVQTQTMVTDYKREHHILQRDFEDREKHFFWNCINLNSERKRRKGLV